MGRKDNIRRILLVDDDDRLVELLKQVLSQQDYQVDQASNGHAGLALAEANQYHLILLDLRLSGVDGIQFCQQRRNQGDLTPILLMTAQNNSDLKIAGLDAGANDYLVKPFEIDELLARMRSLLRWTQQHPTTELTWEGLRLDSNRCQVIYNQNVLPLTAKEYALLELFLRNPYRVFSRGMILDRLWDITDSPGEETVTTHIKCLRQKLKAAGADRDLIETVYGLGYRLKATNQDSSHTPSVKAKRGAGRHGSPVQSQTNEELSTLVEATVAIRTPTQQQTLDKIASIWHRHRDTFTQQISVLEQASLALARGEVPDELLQQAQQDAHKLAGSLGIFGFRQGSEIARRLEDCLKAPDLQDKTPQTCAQVAVWVEDLKQVMAQPTPQPNVLEETNGTKQQSLLDPIQFSGTQTEACILLVDDDVVLVELLKQEAIARGLQVGAAANPAMARQLIAQCKPDVILLDLSFPNTSEDGMTLLAELAAHKSPIPVAVFTGRDGLVDRIKVARLGGRAFLHKPISPEQVLDTLLQILNQTRSSAGTAGVVMAVDDDVALLESLQRLLEPWGLKIVTLSEPTRFWEVLNETVPDLLMLDVEMPNFSGIDLCQVVRNDPRWGDLPIVVLTAHTDSPTIHAVFAAGADDYIGKPFIEPALIARITSYLERAKMRRHS